MHTLEYDLNATGPSDQQGKVENMLYCHHHGDFSGEVELVVPTQYVLPLSFDSSNAVEQQRIKVPMQFIREIVAEELRSEMISHLEQADAQRILKLSNPLKK